MTTTTHSPSTGDASLPRFLVVSPERETPVSAGLERFVALGCSLARATSVLESERYGEADLVLYDLACGALEFAALRARLPGALVMLFGPSAEESLAEELLAKGAHHWLRTGEGGDSEAERVSEAVERLLVLGPRPALPRPRRRRAGPARAELMRLGECEELPLAAGCAEPRELAVPPGAAAAESEPTQPVPVPAARRAAAVEPARTRWKLVQLVEVADDGGPARRGALALERVECFGEHVLVELESDEAPRADVVVGAFEWQEKRRWASFELRRLTALGGRRHEAELVLLRGPSDFFREAALLPVFDPASMRYRRPELGERGRAWAELGVLREIELDRVLVCPRCHSLPTFRSACRRCGSAKIDGQRLIHHFPCAHVGFVKDFQLEGAMVCPKCGGNPLVVNSDFEYLDGPAKCGECGSGEADGELVGHCFGCGTRFLGRVAATHTLKGFHADRMDPLDLGLPAE